MVFCIPEPYPCFNEFHSLVFVYLLSMQYKTLIVDDEPLARLRMTKLLEPYADVVSLVGEANCGEQAVAKIQELQPDLVFLDIQMPDMNGFDVLKAVGEDAAPVVVFTTAFDEFALRAYEEDTVDYLLKPVDEERLRATMDKLRRFAGAFSGEAVPRDEIMKNFRTLMNEKESYLQRLQVKIGDRTLLIPVDGVYHFQSEDKYTTIYTAQGKYIIDTPLVELEARLDPNQFVRVHRAHLVAIDAIEEYQRTIGGRFCVKLKDKTSTLIPVSRNFVNRIRSL